MTRARLLALALALVAIVVLLLTADRTQAAPRGGWGTQSTSRSLQRQVEHQPWYDSCGMLPTTRTDCVHNPTACAWDPDDGVVWSAGGRMLPYGAQTTITECLIADWHSPLIGVRASPELDVTLWVDGLFAYRIEGGLGCLIGPEYDFDAHAWLPSIEGSNGGVGQRYEVHVTAVARPDRGRWLKEAGLVGSINLDANTKRAAYCDSPLVRVGAYPGPWWWVAV